MATTPAKKATSPVKKTVAKAAPSKAAAPSRPRRQPRPRRRPKAPGREGASGAGQEGRAGQEGAGHQGPDQGAGRQGGDQRRRAASTPSSSRARRRSCWRSGPSCSAQAERLEGRGRLADGGPRAGDVQFDDESGEGDTLVVERERDLALSAQARQTIADIDAALARIEDGTYGFSVVSGRPIPKERLRGHPVGHRAGRGEGRRARHSPVSAAARAPVTRRASRCTAVIGAVAAARRRRRPAHQAVGGQRARRRPRHRRRLDAAVQPHVQQRHGLQPGPRPRAVHRRRRPRRDRGPARRRCAATARRSRPSPSAWSSAARSATCSTACSGRRRLPRRRGGRLHRPAVVAGVQRGRRGHRGRRRDPGRRLGVGPVAGRTSRSEAVSVTAGRADPGGARRRAGRPRRRHARRVQPRRGRRRWSTAGAVTLDGGRGHRRASSASRPARRSSVDVARAARAGAPAPDPTIAGRGRPRRRRRDRGRQAGRAGRAPGRRAGRRARSSTGCWPATRSSPASASPDRPGIVHRLDTGTSGLLVVARHRGRLRRARRAQLSARRGRRARYLALVWGVPEAAQRHHRRADRPLDRATPPAWRWSAGGKEARTRYEVRDRSPGARRRARCSTAGSRPAAPTRSASTSPPSATRSSATTATAAPATASTVARARSCTPPPGLRPPGQPASALTFTSPLPADLAAVLGRAQLDALERA